MGVQTSAITPRLPLRNGRCDNDDNHYHYHTEFQYCFFLCERNAIRGIMAFGGLQRLFHWSP
jgi:hypothetical protein